MAHIPLPPSPRVFIPNDTGFDFSAARKYGTPVFLVPFRVGKTKVTKIFLQCQEVLEDVTPYDFLVVQMPVITAIAAAMIGHKYGKVNFLIWNDRTSEYEPNTVVFNNLQNLKGELNDRRDKPQSGGSNKPR